MAQNKGILHVKYGSVEPFYGDKGLTYGVGDARLMLQNELSKHHACEARFLIMIELTTGIAFLMSSLYGAGQANAQAYTIPADIDSEDSETQTMNPAETRSFIDSKEVEAYVRKNYSDEPFLVDIARCESTFRQFHKDGTVVRGRVNKADVGVLQINEKYHAATALKLGYDIYTLEGNMAYGKYLYDRDGAQPWSASSKCWLNSNELAKK